MTEQIEPILTSAVFELAKRNERALDAYLLALFGSAEDAVAMSKFYVIEDHPMKIETTKHGFVLTTNVVVRPKTFDELTTESPRPSQE